MWYNLPKLPLKKKCGLFEVQTAVFQYLCCKNQATNYDHFHLFLSSRGAIICQYLLLFGTRIGHLSFEPPASVPAHRLHLFRRTIVPDYHIAHRCFHSPSRRPRPLATLKESVAQNERPYRNTERFCLSIFHFVKYPPFTLSNSERMVKEPPFRLSHIERTLKDSKLQ